MEDSFFIFGNDGKVMGKYQSYQPGQGRMTRIVKLRGQM